MPQEGAMLMSRLEMVSPTRAKIVMEGLYKDLERRIEASQPGLCPVDLARAFLELCYAQTCGKCVPCRIGLKQLMFLIQDVLDGKATMDTLKLMEETCLLYTSCLRLSTLLAVAAGKLRTQRKVFWKILCRK